MAATRRSSKKAISRPPGSRRRCYKKNFLSAVVARLDFESEVSLPKSAPPKSVYTVLKGQFPNVEDKSTFTQTVQFDASGMKQEKTEQKQWGYFSADRKKGAFIGKQHLSLEYTSYDSFDELKQDFASAVEAISKLDSDIQVRRFGLRFVNNIELDETNPTEWSNYLSEKLLASFELASDAKTICRMFNTIEFNYGDTMLRCQYGMANPDYPVPIRKKLFTLDYDAFTSVLLGLSEIGSYFDDLHEKIAASFEDSIKDGLRKKMGIKNE